MRLWADAPSLPELNLENESVKHYIYKDEQSVIRSYLKMGVDGWRLDVAFDLGFEILKELRDYARKDKKDVMIVGEIWNYPEKWLKSIDGVMNFTFREITLRLLRGELSPKKAMSMLSDTVSDAGIEPILKCWNLLDNHDVARLKNLLDTTKLQKLPSASIYITRLTKSILWHRVRMDGGNDEPCLRWDLVNEHNETLTWTKKLFTYNQERALKIGDFIPLYTDNLLCFMRVTENVEDTCIVAINPSNKDVSETVLLKDSRLMNFSGFNIILGEVAPLTLLAGLINIKLKPHGYVVFKPKTADKSYTPYKRA